MTACLFLKYQPKSASQKSGLNCGGRFIVPGTSTVIPMDVYVTRCIAKYSRFAARAAVQTVKRLLQVLVALIDMRY